MFASFVVCLFVCLSLLLLLGGVTVRPVTNSFLCTILGVYHKVSNVCPALVGV